MIGKPNGRLLIGIKVDHEPFSRSADTQIFQLVTAAMFTHFSEYVFSVFFFQSCVPARLARRQVLTGAEAGKVVETPESLLDETEVREMSVAVRLKAANDSTRAGRDYEKDWACQQEAYEFSFPLKCKKSSLRFAALKHDLPLPNESDPLNLLWMLEKNRAFRRFLALVDYGASVGKSREFAKHAWENDGRLCGYFHRVSSVMDGPEFLIKAMNTRRRFLDNRMARTAEKRSAKNKPTIQYLACFDTLNFGKPVLAGFVRQPYSNNVGVKIMREQWDYIVRTLPGSPAEWLYKGGYKSGHLSLDWRAATSEEVLAYDVLCKLSGATYKCILVSAVAAVGFRAKNTCEPDMLENTPNALRHASLGRATHPRLIREFEWRGSDRASVFQVIRNAQPQLTAAFDQNVVDTDNVLMAEFARKASLKPCIDPVVLASGLLDTWRFTTDACGWRAVASKDDWTVELDTTAQSIDLTIRLAGQQHTQRIFPYTEELTDASFRSPYDGYLSALQPLLKGIRAMAQHSLDAAWEEEDGKVTKFSWFVSAVFRTLRGHGPFSTMFCLTDWPYFFGPDTEDPTSA